MKISITINTCGDCKHRGNTGAFTKNGALVCCHHSGSPKTYRMSNHTMDDSDKEWKIARIKNKSNIPSWCPLKTNGR